MEGCAPREPSDLGGREQEGEEQSRGKLSSPPGSAEPDCLTCIFVHFQHEVRCCCTQKILEALHRLGQIL